MHHKSHSPFAKIFFRCFQLLFSEYPCDSEEKLQLLMHSTSCLWQKTFNDKDKKRKSIHPKCLLWRNFRKYLRLEKSFNLFINNKSLVLIFKQRKVSIASYNTDSLLFLFKYFNIMKSEWSSYNIPFSDNIQNKIKLQSQFNQYHDQIMSSFVIPACVKFTTKIFISSLPIHFSSTYHSSFQRGKCHTHFTM